MPVFWQETNETNEWIKQDLDKLDEKKNARKRESDGGG
jgi:hypothetical protein